MTNELKAKEQKLWDKFEDENSMSNDLLDMSIDVMKGYKKLCTELRELLESCTDELTGYRVDHGDYSHEYKGDYLYDALQLLKKFQ